MEKLPECYIFVAGTHTTKGYRYVALWAAVSLDLVEQTYNYAWDYVEHTPALDEVYVIDNWEKRYQLPDYFKHS